MNGNCEKLLGEKEVNAGKYRGRGYTNTWKIMED